MIILQPRRRNRKQAQAGVTLIEMLVVVTIIGLFVALVGPALWKQADAARITATKSQIQNFMTALGSYKLDTGTFPATELGLQALRVKPAEVNQWAGPYMPRTSRAPKTGTSTNSPGHGDGRTSFRWAATASLGARTECRHCQLEELEACPASRRRHAGRNGGFVPSSG